MLILVGFLSIPAGILRNSWNSWIPAGFRGFRPESVEEWKVLPKSGPYKFQGEHYKTVHATYTTNVV